jgi:hypothetical protein
VDAAQEHRYIRDMSTSDLEIPTEKRNWRSYFAEFAMLFLAVTLGFFADSIRESIGEVRSERGYLESLRADLAQDTVKLDFSIASKITKEGYIDSLMLIMRAPDRAAHSSRLYYFARAITVREPFYGTDGTIRQLENAGGFRLIRNTDVVKALNNYLSAREKIYQIQQQRDMMAVQYRLASSRVLDGLTFNAMLDRVKYANEPYFIGAPEGNPPLFSEEPAALNAFIYWAGAEMSAETYSHGLMRRLKGDAISLIQRIDAELASR